MRKQSGFNRLRFMALLRSKKAFAFNVWDIESAKAVIDACRDFGAIALLQTSAKVFSTLDKEEFLYLTRNYAERTGTNLIVHLDHCRDVVVLQEAIEAGWDSVMYDGSNLELYENIRMTNEVATYCRHADVAIEAEIGSIKGVEDGIVAIEGGVARIEEVKAFLDATDVDMLAIAVGTAHGQYGGKSPHIDFGLIEEVGRIKDVPVVIHGGSELAEDILSKLLGCWNVVKINISTDLKQAYRFGILEALRKNLLEEAGFEALKVIALTRNSICQMARSKLRLLQTERE